MPRKGKKKDKQIENEKEEKKEEQLFPTPKDLEQKDNGNEGVIAFCPCKTQMVPVRADSIYESFVPVFCNTCWTHIPAANTVYHCPKGIKGRCWDHPIGYDICEVCAKKQSVNAQPKKSDNKSEDKNIMKKLFNRNKKDSKENENKQETIGVLNINISPTLQSILTQQLFLQMPKPNDNNNNNEINENLVNHLSIIDEITRLSALSNSTLSQLSYCNKNDKTVKHSVSDLQQMIVKFNALQQLQGKLIKMIDELSVESYKMIQVKLNEWRKWNKYEVAEWIMSLDEGRFYKKYCVKIDSETDEVNIVKQSILQQNICGKHLDLSDKKRDILIQSLGINDFDDRLALLDHIQALVNGSFKYDQTLALVPAKKNEIPGYEKQKKEIDVEKGNDEMKQEEYNEMVNEKDPGAVPVVEGVNLNDNDAK